MAILVFKTFNSFAEDILKLHTLSCTR